MAKVQSPLAEALELLRYMEWSGYDDSDSRFPEDTIKEVCPICCGKKPFDDAWMINTGRGHKPNCRLKVLLDSESPATPITET